MLVAAATLITLVSGCTDNLEPTRVEQGDTYFFSVKANKSEALTKSLTAVQVGSSATHNIISKWDINEEVGVYNSSDENVGTLVAKSISQDGKTATLEGTISNTVTKDDELTLKVQSPDNYGSQDGTLEYIASHCNYQTATVTIGSVDDGKAYATTKSVSFQSQQAILAFNLRLNSYTQFNPSDLSIRYGNNIIGFKTINIHNIDFSAVRTSNGASGFNFYAVFVVAIPGYEGDLTLTGTDKDRAGELYYKEDVNIKNGKAYFPTVYLYRDLYTALTFEAMEDGAKVTFTPGNNVDITQFEYSITKDIYDDVWDDFVAFTGEEGNNVITLPQEGRKVRFRGKVSSCAYSAGEANSSTFSCDKPCYVYGNVMSMVGGNNYHSASDISDAEYESINSSTPGNNAFSNLFNGNENIYNHPWKPLVLPATSIPTHCYYQMFYGCTNLTTAPELPATNLGTSCYLRMFQGCTGLITAPSAIGTANATLADYCCEQMFQGCISLKTVPALPATTLAYNCYYQMFYGCTSLTTAPELPAGTLATGCYTSMFSGCTSLATAPALSATSLATYCYREMFRECTSLTTAPALPAETLQEYCYYQMFFGCTNLTTPPARISSSNGTLGESCCGEMFYECINLTTAPELPATTIPVGAYAGMFLRCTSLTEAPDLPATTLVESNQQQYHVYARNYAYMFKGCTSLTKAPALPAKTLTTQCYEHMFDGCTSLTTNVPSQISASDGSLAFGCCANMFYQCTNLKTAPALPATTLGQQCYEYMFFDCPSLVTAPALPATTLRTQCYRFMFAGCSALTATPVLGAAEMVKECYEDMFYNCSNLKTVICLATSKDTYATSCFNNWLSGVSATGTFYKSPNAGTFWDYGGYIPANWTVLEYSL